MLKDNKYSFFILGVPALLWTGYVSFMFLWTYCNVSGGIGYAQSPVNPAGVYGQYKYYLLVVFGLLFAANFILISGSLLKKRNKLFFLTIFVTVLLTFLAFVIVESD